MVEFRQLDVWHRARSVVREAYAQTASFPRSEMFGLMSQMRRSAVSIAANLAEGSELASDPDFARFVGIARGSAAELYTHIVLAEDVGLIDAAVAGRLREDVQEVRKTVAALHRTLTAAQ